ncbi:MAG: hypothetical protein WBQ54_15155, partial [Pseudolabrys sp.]
PYLEDFLNAKVYAHQLNLTYLPVSGDECGLSATMTGCQAHYRRDDLSSKRKGPVRSHRKTAMGNGMSIGWMGWPARPSALFGSLMVVSATAPTHFNAEQARSSKETLWSQLIRNATYALILLVAQSWEPPPTPWLV